MDGFGQYKRVMDVKISHILYPVQNRYYKVQNKDRFGVLDNRIFYDIRWQDDRVMRQVDNDTATLYGQLLWLSVR